MSPLTRDLDLEVADVNKAQARHKWHVSSRGSVSDPAPSPSHRVLQVFTDPRTVGAGIAKLDVFIKVAQGPL